MSSLLRLALVVLALQAALWILAVLFQGGGPTMRQVPRKPWTRGDYKDAGVGLAILFSLPALLVASGRLTGCCP